MENTYNQIWFQITKTHFLRILYSILQMTYWPTPHKMKQAEVQVSRNMLYRIVT